VSSAASWAKRSSKSATPHRLLDYAASRRPLWVLFAPPRPCGCFSLTPCQMLRTQRRTMLPKTVLFGRRSPPATRISNSFFGPSVPEESPAVFVFCQPTGRYCAEGYGQGSRVSHKMGSSHGSLHSTVLRSSGLSRRTAEICWRQSLRLPEGSRHFLGGPGNGSNAHYAAAAFGGARHCTSEAFLWPVAFLPVQSAPNIGGPFLNQSHGPSKARGLFKNRSNLANSCSSVHGNGSRHGFRIWKSRSGLASVLDSATTSSIASMNPSMPGA
jgi:hypothetical protein